jgi:peptidyl-prolyl cis-trans isomerase C
MSLCPRLLRLTLLVCAAPPCRRGPSPSSRSTLPGAAAQPPAQPSRPRRRPAPSRPSAPPAASRRQPSQARRRRRAAAQGPGGRQVNGQPIYLSELEVAQQALPQQYRSMPLATVFPALLDRIVDSKLVVADARKNKIDADPTFKKRLAFVDEQLPRTTGCSARSPGASRSRRCSSATWRS